MGLFQWFTVVRRVVFTMDSSSIKNIKEFGPYGKSSPYGPNLYAMALSKVIPDDRGWQP